MCGWVNNLNMCVCVGYANLCVASVSSLEIRQEIDSSPSSKMSTFSICMPIYSIGFSVISLSVRSFSELQNDDNAFATP